MNRALVDKIAQALLYEGYILYPYRPSVKSRQRWTFGGLYPRSWSESQETGDAWTMQTEVLVHGAGDATVEVSARFLHLIDRTVGELLSPVSELSADGEPEFRTVETLQIGGNKYQAWQEATERRFEAGEFKLDELTRQPRGIPFSFPFSRKIEPLRDSGDSKSKIVGLLIREQQGVEGEIELSCLTLAKDLHRITVKIVNRTKLPNAAAMSRDDALVRSLLSMHTILGVHDGEFVSLTDPPEPCRAFARDCKNIGAWPVLIGQGTEHDTMLSSPIIVSDYPQLAPESPGDLFDSTEIDEILTLRIMTLTDEEKSEAASVDDRVKKLLSRTESLARDQLMNLHGTVRGLRPVPQEQSHG